MAKTEISFEIEVDGDFPREFCALTCPYYCSNVRCMLFGGLAFSGYPLRHPECKEAEREFCLNEEACKDVGYNIGFQRGSDYILNLVDRRR